MSKPLAVLYYSTLMPGGQIANRLLDLGYRVHTLSDATHLTETCQKEKPLVVVAEVLPVEAVCVAVARLRQDAATGHIPVLGYAAAQDPAQQRQAAHAGVTLLAGTAAIAEHLPRLLDQVLQIE